MKILYNLYAISGFLNAIFGVIAAVANFYFEQYDYMFIAIVMFVVGVVQICLHRQLYNDVQKIKELDFKVDFRLNQIGQKDITIMLNERDEEND